MLTIFYLFRGDCHETYAKGKTESGVYYIKPKQLEISKVYCVMEGGKGWNVMLRRTDDTTFVKTLGMHWFGFGSHEGSFWSGM